MSVASIPDDELLRRVVTNVRSRRANKGIKHMRWVAVMDGFGLGRSYSIELCARFGLDPDEMVKR
jgi:hypothetical protein